MPCQHYSLIPGSWSLNESLPKQPGTQEKNGSKSQRSCYEIKNVTANTSKSSRVKPSLKNKKIN